MKLQQLHLLCALEQYRSFSQTAQHLFISQPALSTAMQALEKELRCTLLIRNKSRESSLRRWQNGIENSP